MDFLKTALVACAAASCSDVSPAIGQAPVRNGEYGFEAAFPANHPVCEARSGEHPHGFYVNLEAPCREGEPGERSLSIWADYNTAEWGLDQLRNGYCGANSVSPPPNVANMSIGGLKTKNCMTKGAEGEIVVTAVAQRGSAAKEYGAPNAVGGHINYRVTLVTTQQKLSEDVQAYRSLLNGLKMVAIE